MFDWLLSSLLTLLLLGRYMMLIDGKNEVHMIDRDNSIFHVANLEFPFRKDMNSHLTNTLLDGVSMRPLPYGYI